MLQIIDAIAIGKIDSHIRQWSIGRRQLFVGRERDIVLSVLLMTRGFIVRIPFGSTTLPLEYNWNGLHIKILKGENTSNVSCQIPKEKEFIDNLKNVHQFQAISK